MPAGMQIWDEAENLVVDLTTRMGRIVGEVFIPAGSSGSVTVDASRGQPFAFPMALAFPSGAPPILTIDNSSGVISWSPPPSNASDVQMIYGVW